MQKAIKISVLTCGSPAAWAESAIAHWLRRLGTLANAHIAHIRSKNQRKLEKAMLEHMHGRTIALTRTGRLLTTPQWAESLQKIAEMHSHHATFLIGAADGLPERLLSACDERISLSKITLQHDIALIVLLEQLYRALSIGARLPYHRGE